MKSRDTVERNVARCADSSFRFRTPRAASARFRQGFHTEWPSQQTRITAGATTRPRWHGVSHVLSGGIKEQHGDITTRWEPPGLLCGRYGTQSRSNHVPRAVTQWAKGWNRLGQHSLLHCRDRRREKAKYGHTRSAFFASTCSAKDQHATRRQYVPIGEQANGRR